MEKKARETWEKKDERLVLTGGDVETWTFRLEKKAEKTGAASRHRA